MLETITAREALDKFWELFLGSFRGLLLLVFGILHTIARIAFTLMQKVLYIIFKAHEFVKLWKPVTPTVFDLGVHHGQN
jgi:hypothetical protein